MRHHNIYLVVPPACAAAWPLVGPATLLRSQTASLAVGLLMRSAAALGRRGGSPTGSLAANAGLRACCCNLIPLAVPSHGDVLVFVGTGLEHLPLVVAVHGALEDNACLKRHFAFDRQLVAAFERGKASRV